MSTETGSNYVGAVTENGRQEGLQLAEQLNNTTGIDFQPIINELTNADRVDCKISEPFEVSMDRVQNEENRRNPLRQVYDALEGPVQVVSALLSILGMAKNGVTQQDIDKEIMQDQVEGQIQGGIGNFINDLINSNNKILTGYDAQGDKIDKVYRQTFDIYTESDMMARSDSARKEIYYDYHIVNGKAKVLSVSVNGEIVADYYGYQS